MVKIATYKQKKWITKNYPHTKNYLKRKGTLYIYENNEDIDAFAFIQRRNIVNNTDKYEDLILVIEVFDENKRCNGIGTALVNVIKENALCTGAYQVIAFYETHNIPSHKLWIKNDFGVSSVTDRNGNNIGCVAIWKCL